MHKKSTTFLRSARELRSQGKLAFPHRGDLQIDMHTPSLLGAEATVQSELIHWNVSMRQLESENTWKPSLQFASRNTNRFSE